MAHNKVSVLYCALVVAGCGHWAKSEPPTSHFIESALGNECANCRHLTRQIVPQLERLHQGDIEVREQAKLAILRTLSGSERCGRIVLRQLSNSALDPEARTTLNSLLQTLPSLAIELEVGNTPILGKEVDLKVAIRNITDEVIVATRSIVGSDSGLRYPSFEIQYSGPNYKRGGLFRFEEDPYPEIRHGDFITLPPGQKYDPFGNGSYKNWVLRMGIVPERIGPHSVVVTVDFSAQDCEAWLVPSSDGQGFSLEISRLLARVPKVRIQKSIEFEVIRE